MPGMTSTAASSTSLANPRFVGATSRGEAFRASTATLRAAGVENADREARLLLVAASGLGAVDLIVEPGAALGETAAAQLERFLARRAAHEPLSRIVGQREFWSLELAISPNVLDPRPDTETVVEAALAAFAGRREEKLRILDLGAGSGAILCALLSELPNAFGVAAEISPEAAGVARANLAALGFAARSSVVVGRWAEAVDGRFDIVVSNPPYIASAEIDNLAPEVRGHDPRLALDGGRDGLDAYRAIAGALGRIIAPRGAFFLEIGAGQGEAVSRLMAEAGMGDLALIRDLAGRDRVARGRPLAAADQDKQGVAQAAKQGPWRETKKRLVLSSESSSAPSPSESRAAAGSAGACRAQRQPLEIDDKQRDIIRRRYAR
jgi:release factor glutamine methyltransferase